MAVSVADSKRAAYLFPLLVPLLTGLLLAFAKLLAGMAETSAMIDSVALLNRLLRTDLNYLWTGAHEGIVVSMAAVDIWALTLLYASRSNPAPYAFVYPIVGVFLHFILILVVVALHQTAVSLDRLALMDVDLSQLGAADLKGWEEEKEEASWRADNYRALASVTTVISVVVAVYVRHGIWRLHDAQEWALKVANRHNSVETSEPQDQTSESRPKPGDSIVC